MKWTVEKIEYLESNYGTMDINKLAKKIGTSVCAVKRKAYKEGLGSAVNNSGLITLKELGDALGVSNNKVTRWVNEFGLAARRTNITGKKRFYRISILTFWTWAKEHKKLIDFDKFEKGNLGKEPIWADNCRTGKESKNYKLWTKEEDLRLTTMWNAGITTQKIADTLHRKYGAIEKRRMVIGLKPKKTMLIWQQVEEEILLNMLAEGKGNKEIAWELGREVYQVGNKRQKLIKKGIIKPSHKRNSKVLKVSNAIVPEMIQNITTRTMGG